MSVTVEYKNQILEKLKGVAMYQTCTVRPEELEKIEAIKIIIDWDEDRAHGFQITFNSTFTKFKKHPTLWRHRHWSYHFEPYARPFPTHSD